MQLVINTRGTLLCRRGERFVIRGQNNQTHEFSAKKIHSIVIATGVRMTSNIIQLAAENNVDIVFLDSSGFPNSRVWQTRLGSTAAIRRKQLEICETDAGFEFARQWVVKKLQNQVEFLVELRTRRPSNAAELANSITSIEDSVRRLEDLNGTLESKRSTIMGIEGTAGRVYFQALSKLMPREYTFAGRSRRPAADPFNAMLNYAYGVLYSQIDRALILAGLDPFIGFLHTDHYNKRSLVYDMIEPFRVVAERTAVLLFTGRRVKREFFREVPGGIELSPAGRAPLVESLNKRLDKSVRYPVQKPKGTRKHRQIKLRDTIRHEAHGLANELLGKHDIPSVIETENLFQESMD